jgi:hypothetical protein
MEKIRIRDGKNTDPQHCLYQCQYSPKKFWIKIFFFSYYYLTGTVGIVPFVFKCLKMEWGKIEFSLIFFSILHIVYGKAKISYLLH